MPVALVRNRGPVRNEVLTLSVGKEAKSRDLSLSHHTGALKWRLPNHFYFPCEPEEIGISSHQPKKNSTDHEALIDKISQEMFDGITREVVEEIGVPAESLHDPIFIGISRRDLNVRPTAFFFVSCNLKSHQIQQLYSGAQDGYESTQLYAVSAEELLKMSERMPGCHRGGHALYELMTKAKKDC